ncbi:bifunctional biotin--[acetyl-CoA-carboxylase] ligase/biotin operon repressor BirA [Vibrio sp. TH_r3]|uniref:bifunctional biotin--[acetyl-CoA-carboxylase] ligase/biotin operon repressor BirA n=1 Tax=Vibrio sp. TH_r3 TaxID=3082084 RepID=UPI002954C33A|nr:bifunctional biotin--[acetyl-CoA-carboxylase] ligase/biotin operon repressor BirA [Vibrio sp. TH_r3]MDV7106398.1 bifunctional biotin--[acetyl-CoA-carboxylase] ligase/biotin operon repressor BirA [Vibrio sp. TH_r3]
MKDYSVKLKIIELLSSGEFVSGEVLGTKLGISRAAIGKHIKSILAWGLDIYRIQGKGYRLSKPIELLHKQKIEALTKQHVELIPVIDSTNQYLLERNGSLESGATCLAEYQSHGRGRRGRQWVSPFGSNLYLSMYWKLEAGMAASMGLSLVVGVAVVEALESIGIKGIKLKWPNDLYHNDKKLAGILVEMNGQAGGAAHLVIGMGMNIDMPMAIAGIDQPWTSLSGVTSDLPERNILAATIINTWKKTLEDYELFGMNEFVPRWNRLDNFIDRPVKLLMGEREVSGVVKGINDQGAILIETHSGVQSFIGGEISLRKDNEI